MAIQHSRTLSSIEVLNSGDTDVVCQVEVDFISYDDSDQDLTTVRSSQTFKLETVDRSSSSDGWVPYADLTEETVFGWLGSDSEFTDAETRFQTNHTTRITMRLNPPAPPTVNKELPW